MFGIKAAHLPQDRERTAGIGHPSQAPYTASLRTCPAARGLRLARPVSPLLLLLLLRVALPRPAAAQDKIFASADMAKQLAPTLRDLALVLPSAPIGAHCTGSVVCTDLGTWGVHARLTGATIIRGDSSVPGGLLTPAASLSLGGWVEVGAQFPILLGPLDSAPLPLPPVLFAKGAFTPPFRIGSHGVLFATLTMPNGPFGAPDDSGQPMSRRYEVGAAISGHLLWMFYYGLSVSGQISPGGSPSRLLTGVELRARFDGFSVYAQPTYNAALCERGSSSKACQSSTALIVGVQIPFVAGHASAAAGLIRGAPDQQGTSIAATVGMSYDEATRAKYGDGIQKIERLWVHLFTSVIDPYLDERCILWDDDHSPMTALGAKSADGLYCERDGLRTPVGTHFDRNKASTRVCYDAGLRNCILRRVSDKDPWQVIPAAEQARRPYLKEDCHVYDRGVMLPLQQVGFRSDDGLSCRWRGHQFPIGTQFWAVPGDDVMCKDATLKDCTIALPPRPMTAAQYVSSRAEQGLVHGVTNLVEKFERGPQIAADLATGKLHVGTVAGEAYATLKEGVGHLTLEDAEKKATAVAEAGRAWLHQPLHQQLGDVAEAAGSLPAQVLENEAMGGLGSFAGGASGAARVGARAEKTAVKVEKNAVKVQHAAADTAQAGKKALGAADGTGPYEHLPAPRSIEAGKKVTPMQKREIHAENRKRNGGVLRDDETGELLSAPRQSTMGVTPPPNEAHIDHVVPKSTGGTNGYSNLRVISRQRNLEKGNKVKP